MFFFSFDLFMNGCKRLPILICTMVFFSGIWGFLPAMYLTVVACMDLAVFVSGTVTT